jgi:hypothetical protein
MTNTQAIQEYLETITVTGTISDSKHFVTGTGTTPEEIGKVAVKFDSGKLDWSLMPLDSVEEILKVLEFGKKKYAAWNWSSNGGFPYSRVFNSLLRHLFAWFRGEDNDPETNLSHLAHAGCNILFLIYFVKHKDKYTTNDDRPSV